MNTTLWILQGVLAAVMTMAGMMKASQGKAKLSGDPKMAWVEDFTDAQVRSIGGAEVAGAAGLILPWALDIGRALTPIADGSLANPSARIAPGRGAAHVQMRIGTPHEPQQSLLLTGAPIHISASRHTF